MKFHLASLLLASLAPAAVSDCVITPGLGGDGKATIDVSLCDIVSDGVLLEQTVTAQVMTDEPIWVFNHVPGEAEHAGVYHGKTADGKAEVTLAEDADGEFFGSITVQSDGTIWNISNDAAGVHTVVKQDQNSFHDGDEGNILNAPLEAERALQERREKFGKKGLRGLGTVNLDLLIVYSPAAECVAAGLAAGCTSTDETQASIAGKIALGMEEANAGLANSDTGIQLALTSMYKAEGYSELDFASALEDITLGSIPGVHEKRKEDKADLVSFWLTGDGCGLAWIGPHKDYAYSTVNIDCATGYYSFPHELAHNLGCGHDIGTENACEDDASKAWGYRDPNAEFRSIMSYSCKSNQCDQGSDDGPCTRVLQFSSSTASYNGQPTGNEAQNCAGQIAAVAADIALYGESL